MVSLRFRCIKTTLKVEPTTQSRSPPLTLSRLCALFLVIVRKSRDTHQVLSRRSASPISSCRFYTGETDFGALDFHDCILLPAFFSCRIDLCLTPSVVDAGISDESEIIDQFHCSIVFVKGEKNCVHAETT